MSNERAKSLGKLFVFEKVPVPYWGLVGSLVLILGAVVSSIAYIGETGESYSFLNHFISELGNLGVSELAGFFNGSLIVGGIFLFFYLLGLALYIDNWIARLGGLAGMFSSIACSFVGIYPMNYLEEHSIAAFSFFFGGLITVLLFSVAILVDKSQKFPKHFSLFGLAVAACFALFLYYPYPANNGGGGENMLDPEAFTRPDFWLITFFEWLVFISVISWILLSAIYMVFEQKKKGE